MYDRRQEIFNGENEEEEHIQEGKLRFAESLAMLDKKCSFLKGESHKMLSNVVRCCQMLSSNVVVRCFCQMVSSYIVRCCQMLLSDVVVKCCCRMVSSNVFVKCCCQMLLALWCCSGRCQMLVVVVIENSVCFLIRIHSTSMEDWTATAKHGVDKNFEFEELNVGC